MSAPIRKAPPPSRSGGLIRGFRRVALTVLAVGLLFTYLSGGSNGCPPRTSFDTSVMSDYCTAPSGRVVCVIDSFGFTPRPGGDVQGDEFVRRPPLGPWCRGAHALTFGPQVRPITVSTK